MEEKIMDIANRIRELREVCGYSAEQLAEELSIDVQTYVGYEENGENIPISVIYQIASKFGVDFTEIITGVAAKLDSYHVIRQGNGLSVDRYPGYSFRDLAFRFNHKIMQPLLVTIDPSDKPADLVRHSGQEFNFILDGSIVFVYGNKEMVLEKGDSVYFNPNHPHGQKCAGNAKATFLTIIAE